VRRGSRARVRSPAEAEDQTELSVVGVAVPAEEVDGGSGYDAGVDAEVEALTQTPGDPAVDVETPFTSGWQPS